MDGREESETHAHKGQGKTEKQQQCQINRQETGETQVSQGKSEGGGVGVLLIILHKDSQTWHLHTAHYTWRQTEKDRGG